jgi:hypothetical protein
VIKYEVPFIEKKLAEVSDGSDILWSLIVPNKMHTARILRSDVIFKTDDIKFFNIITGGQRGGVPLNNPAKILNIETNPALEQSDWFH